MNSKDTQTTNLSPEEKYSIIEKKLVAIRSLKTSIKELNSKKQKTPDEVEYLRKADNALQRLESQTDELRESFSKRQKHRIIKEQYRLLFESDLTINESLVKAIEAVFDPTLLLRDQFRTLELLKEKIVREEAEPQDSDEFFILLKKVNAFLTILKNLGMNVPEPKKSAAIRAQRGMIKAPIYGAEVFSKLLIKSKREINRRFKNIENSVEEYVAFQGLESVRETLLSVPSFFATRKPEAKPPKSEAATVTTEANRFLARLKGFEERVRTTETRDLHKLYAEILLVPFEIVEQLGLDPKDPDNHPKNVFYELTQGKKRRKKSSADGETKNPFVNLQDRSFVEALGDAIEKHEIIASLLNMEFSYWRRFSLLNLETIKSVINRMKPDVLRAITFDETQIIPSFIDLQKVTQEFNRTNELDDQTELQTLIEEHRALFRSYSNLNDPELSRLLSEYDTLAKSILLVNPEELKKLIIEQKRRINSKIQIIHLNQVVESAIGNTFVYDYHQWKVGDGSLGTMLREQQVESAFTSYNRGLINSRDNEKVNASVPRSAYAILKPSLHPDRRFDVKLEWQHGTHSDARYNQYHSRMLECWIDSKGDVEQTRKLWEKKLEILKTESPSEYPEELIRIIAARAKQMTESEQQIYLNDRAVEIMNQYERRTGTAISTNHLNALFSYLTKHRDSSPKEALQWWKEIYCNDFHIPSFDELLSRVYTLPCILLPTTVSSSENVNDLQQELTQRTNELRSNFVTASMLITYGVNSRGDFALSSSCDHSNWDGKQSGDMVEKMLNKVIENTADIQLNQSEILEHSTSHVDVEKITSSVKEKRELEPQGNHQIQSYVEAEGFVRICDDIGKMVGELMREGQVSPDSKLKNPAVIMQLILAYRYRKILTEKRDSSGKEMFSPTQNIGMLLGNPDIIKDLDLAPIREGFDLDLFTKFNSEQQKEYLINLALLFDIALEHTNMTIIKQVAESIPYKGIQSKLNAISRTRLLLGGLKDLADEFMISNFGLPRIKNGKIQIEKNHGFQVIRNSGPAQTDFQKGSMTIVGALEMADKFYLSICYKNTENAAAMQIATAFKAYIESYNVDYYKHWVEEQKRKNAVLGA